MKNSRDYGRLWLRNLLNAALLTALIISAGIATFAQTAATRPDSLSAGEFSRIIRDFSEDGGYFFSDNFTSNEDSYLTVLDKMRQLGATGGAYVGVGPEQNFTYIAKIRPCIAFIVDIRRQAMIQHLMYKALFHLSATRLDFLSRLLSRPLDAKAPGLKDSIDETLVYLSNLKPSDKFYAENLAAIRKTIREDSQFPLSTEDQESLEYVYRNFRNRGFDVGFDIDGRLSDRFGHLPNLREIIAQKDLNGKQENFLANVEDYNFVREMHRRNMIIPVVGDFAGKKALTQVAAYLRSHKYTLTAFYLSNVEIVLFQYRSRSMFTDFVENVRKLPSNDQSLLIRSTFSYYGHPTQLPAYSLCTMLQSLPAFLRNFDKGRYREYFDVILTDYIEAYKR